MISEFNCPVCSASKWQSIERFYYDRKDHSGGRSKSLGEKLCSAICRFVLRKPRKGLIHCNKLTDAHRRLRQVMFEVWFPEQEDIILESLKCRNCGFMAFSPRPEGDDIAAKYEYLQRYDEDFGGERKLNTLEREFEKQRARRVRDLVREHVEHSDLKILDYGGGNGKMMRPFLADNDECFLIDHNTKPISGVIRLGNSVENAEKQSPYDVIVCSHVLEHLSNPRQLLDSLHQLLSEKGVVYAEVPLDIWIGLPIEADPVTHVNFFTPNSFKMLFQSAGFRVLEFQRKFLNYGASFREMLWIVADVQALREQKPLNVCDTNEFLYPSRTYILKRAFCKKGMTALKRAQLKFKRVSQ